MYTLFNNESRMKQTSIVNMNFEYLKGQLMDVQVARYRQYRGDNPGYLKSDHILQKILGLVDIPFDGDLATYYMKVSSIVNRMSGQMGFCNAAHHGRVRNHSHFYGKGVSEIIIAIGGDNVKMSDIWYNWTTMSPVRILSHPFYGCGVVELDGTNDWKDLPQGATAVIEINIPLLACQYQLWRMATRATGPEGFVAPTAHFLTQFIIPNILPSHLDVCVGNTVHMLIGCEDYVKIENKMPFYCADYYPRFEKALKEITERLSNQDLFYTDILANIPVVGQSNLSQTIKLPDIAFTNQAIWALIIARLHVIAMLLKFDQINQNVKNDMVRNRIRRSLVEIESGKYLVNQIPSDVSINVNNYIAKYIAPVVNQSIQAVQPSL